MKSHQTLRPFVARAAALLACAGAVTAAWHDAGRLPLEGVALAQTAPPTGPDILAGFDPAAILGVPDVITSCPGIPPGGFSGVTNDHFYFLSEVGGCSNLPCFLAEVEDTVHANATLIIDEVCTLRQPIRIPSRFTLAGVWPAGEGALVFEDLPDYASAIRVEEEVQQGGVSEIVIRDLGIYRASGGYWNSGINVTGGNIVALEGVRVSGFSMGLYGQDAYSVHVYRSTFYANAFNVMIHRNANRWTFRDSTLGLATLYSVKIFGLSDGPGTWNNDHVFSAVRFEGSGLGAMMLGSYGAMLMNNRFESNGNNGVWITPSATGTRVLSNIFSTDMVHNSGQGTRCAFNIGQLSTDCPEE